MKKVLMSLLILGALGLGAGYFIYNKPHQDMKTAEADINILATELFAAYESNEVAANEKYLDKVVKVSGTIKDVSTDDEGNLTLTLESGSDMFGVVCQMDELTEHERTDFEIGESVSLKGKCTGMLMDVVLVRCVEV